MSDQNAFTIAEFAQRNGNLGKSTVYRLINAGQLEAKKVLSKTIITAEEEQRWRASLPTLRPNAA